MSFDMDEDILQDFLVEAGEILELLQEQLVELENNPDDANLLNAIFRGFHTVKGGAGFLSLTELVDACHGAENVFDILRTGKRRVTPELMDVILQSLDSINAMFVEVQNRQPLTPASPAILDALHHYSEPETAGSVPPKVQTAAPVKPEPVAAATPSASQSDNIDDITEEEFDRMMDELHGKNGSPTTAHTQAAAPAQTASGDDITDDEFEAILDQLHGKGAFIPDTAAKAEVKPAAPAAAAKADDEIDDAEFEALLDQLHGKG
ncbi:MAG: Hpt domain-containing protein, partial [Rheinheimera sp.]|nr:Hpt domain-containing protein [Rheinheimera sp.]